MSSRLSLRSIRRRASFGAAALLLAVGSTGVVRAADKAYSLSLGTDFTSHFISYGADVWGGGNDASPFGDRRTQFVYGTLTLQMTDQLSGFVNIWSDVNDNADSNIGGSVQEVDLNVGFNYSMDKFTFTLAHGCWMYADDTEHVIDFTAAYNDADMIAKGFALNPSMNVHWRYEGNGGQDTGVAVVPGIKPSYTFLTDTKYPVTVSVPMNVAFFSDNFQGGDSGFGYFSVGVGASVPISCIPEKFGAWNVSGNVVYYDTSSDAIPGNPDNSFFVSTISVGMSI